MELVADDRELAACVKIRKQTPQSSLLCLVVVAFWSSFVSTLLGVFQIALPPPKGLALPLQTATAALAAVALAAIPLATVAALRPESRAALSARGLTVLSASLLLTVGLWGTVALLFDGIWRDSLAILIVTAPLGIFLGLGLQVLWAGRYAKRRLADAGILESAIAVGGRRIYDFPRDVTQ